MTKTVQAIFWALAIIAVAVGARNGIVSSRAAGLMLLVLPLVAVLAMGIGASRRSGCGAGCA